jgi:5,10-methylenetetrahydrofolate reductase
MEKIIELCTPLLPEIDDAVKRISELKDFDSIVLREAGGIDKTVLATEIRAKYDKKIYLNISCCDRNRIALRSQLVTAAALGFPHVVLTDGPHPITTRFPSAKAVYDLDALSLLQMLKNGLPNSMSTEPQIHKLAEWKAGFWTGGATKPDIFRAKKSLSFGADFLIVGSQETARCMKQITSKPIILSIRQNQVDVPSAVGQAEVAGADGIYIIPDNSGEQA